MTRLDIIDLEGNSYSRGKAFGVARRRRIQSSMAAWLASLSGVGVGDPEIYLAGLLHETHFAQSVRDHAPDLLEELRGIACGAEQSFDLMFAAQLMDEEWAYRARLSPARQGMQKCSSAAIRAASDTIVIGQNMDLGGFTDGHQIVFRVAPHGTEPGALIFSLSNMVALLGVNTRRIAVCVNSLPQLPTARHGVPVAFVVRKLLQSHSLSDAVNTVQTIPHATGQHYLLADSYDIRSFEASAAGVAEFSSPHPMAVLHTNHPLVESWAVPSSSGANSIARLKSLKDRLKVGHPDLEWLKAALSSSDDPDHPVSRIVTKTPAQPTSPTGMVAFTTGSMISVLRQHSKEIESWVSPGPPSKRDYTRLSMPCELDRRDAG
jgi:isopenicillin-N N-acyltransferase-like protein